MRRTLFHGSLVVFIAALAVSWVTHGTGVVRDDPDRNISIPSELTVPMQVMAAHNNNRIFFRYRWPAEQPGIHHDVLRYEDGQWVRYGRAVPGSEPHGLHEDRVAMMLDDGSVPEFSRYGGYITIGDGIEGMTVEADGDAVEAHPYLGQVRGQDEITKYLPATRSRLGDWSAVEPEATLDALRQAGHFLDLWHWRAQRSNPLDMSDDQFVAEARFGDSGRSGYSTNWDGDNKHPRMMFDPEQVGFRALAWDDVVGGRLGFDDIYYLTEEQAVPFDPDADWQEGDTIPRRLLRPYQGSRADIAVSGQGRWENGFWDVTLTRLLDTGNPLEDKILAHKGMYHVAVSIHRNATGGRWHYVSLPMTLGLDREAEISAPEFQGATPPWDQNWTEMMLFYPGQVSWPHLNSRKHAGADSVRDGVPVKVRHSEAQLAHYGVEAEFRDEIRRQWLLTLLAGVLLIAGFGVALNMLFKKNQGA
jgi:hypothetical protein